MSLIYTSPTSRHNLYLGGKADAKSLTTLQQRNVKRILNVTPSKETGVVAGVPNYFEGSNSSGKSRGRSGFEIIYKRISVYDASTTDMLPYADEIVNFISNGLHHGSVLVHCQRGVSRSATAAIMYLMRKANMSFQQSLKLCQRRRPEVDPIPAFLVQLKKFESDCRSLGYLTALDDADGTLLESGGSVAGRKICASVNNDKRKKNSDDDACSVRDGDKKRKVEGTSIGPSIGPTQKAIIPAKVSLITRSIGPQRPSIGTSVGPPMPDKKNIGLYTPASAGEKLDEK